MPLYLCAVPKGSADDAAKQTIARELTRIHCDLTQAPPTFVHVFFLEDDNLKHAQLQGSIRAGRTEEVVSQLVMEMREAVASTLAMDLEQVHMATRNVPSSWVMEGGDLLPEPGEEAEWLAMHEAKQTG